MFVPECLIEDCAEAVKQSERLWGWTSRDGDADVSLLF
jgi:hypothetical protein